MGPNTRKMLQEKVQLEHEWHDVDDFSRDNSKLITGVYRSAVFDEAEAYALQALSDVEGHRVLDYGCGTGGTTAELLSRGARVTGFDISLLRLSQARQSRSLGAADLLQSAAEMLPFADSTFDKIVGKQILHHLDLKIALPEIARVLCPGGRAVFLEPLIHNPVLEGYRRLTPRLRSPTERALRMRDIAWMGDHFRVWSHHDFILLAILPVLVAALTTDRPWLERVRQWLQRVDRALLDAVPFVGRYCWETVIVLDR